MYMRNDDSHNCLYFMLGATMTALGCMGYCMCKEKGYLEKLSCNHGNGRGILKMKGKRHMGHKCHHGHQEHQGFEEYQGYQMEEESSNMNSNNQQSNTNSKNPENEQQKEQQVTHQEK